MENVVAVRVTTDLGQARYFVTWGRIQDVVDGSELETVDVREARCLEASHIPRPMMILAGVRQPGLLMSPIREQNVALG
jgi:hypothetical protein